LRILVGASLLAFVAGAWTSTAAFNQPSQQPAAAAPSSVLDGVYTAEQATRGKDTFQKSCEACHTVTEHTGKNLAANWGQSSLGDLFDLISSTMPDGDPGSLQPEAYASVIAFFLKESGYPEGKQDLPASSAALAKIRIAPLP